MARTRAPARRRRLDITAKSAGAPPSLAEQIRALIVQGPPVPLAGLARRLEGASASATARAVAALVSAGEVVVVLTAGKEHLARPSLATLAPEEIVRLSEGVERLAKLLRATRARRGKPRRTLWRTDVDACLALGGARAATPPPAPPSPLPVDRPGDTVVAAVIALVRPGEPFVFVPDVVRSLQSRGVLSPQQALVAAAIAGRIELRPESGVGLLAAEDAAQCPRGPTGVPLSYIRLLER